MSTKIVKDEVLEAIERDHRRILHLEEVHHAARSRDENVDAHHECADLRALGHASVAASRDDTRGLGEFCALHFDLHRELPRRR